MEIHQVAIPFEDEEGGATRFHLIQEQKNSKELLKKISEIEHSLKKMIIGQNQAIRSVSSAIKKAAVGLKDPEKPIGVFLLVGPTGTGKTEMAKAVSRHLFGDLTKLVRVDCSEYALPHEYAKLIGAPPGYIGHNEGGMLTEGVKEKKHCVVLFDEIEKAHFKVHNLLLQLMDEGFLTDSKGFRVAFADSIIFLTSNIGVHDIEKIRNRMGFDLKKRERLDRNTTGEAIMVAMKRIFRPEFINRLDDTIVFNSLTVDDCVKIAQQQLEEVVSYLKAANITLTFKSKVARFIGEKGFSLEFGAREVRRLIRSTVENPLSERILNEEFSGSDKIEVDIKRGCVVFKKKTEKEKKDSKDKKFRKKARSSTAAEKSD
jgi:ATP-dependent Clp protease ATP-binding subunit ClpC